MGININGIDKKTHNTKFYIDHLLCLLQFPLPNVRTIPLARNLIGIPKHWIFLMRGLWLSFFKLHSPRTSYHSNTEWVPYQRKTSQLRTGRIPTVNQFCSKQSAWPLNWPRVQRSHPVWKIMTLLCCSVFLCCKNQRRKTQ